MAIGIEVKDYGREPIASTMMLKLHLNTKEFNTLLRYIYKAVHEFVEDYENNNLKQGEEK